MIKTGINGGWNYTHSVGSPPSPFNSRLNQLQSFNNLILQGRCRLKSLRSSSKCSLYLAIILYQGNWRQTNMVFLGLMSILILGSKKIPIYNISLDITYKYIMLCECGYQILVTKIWRQDFLHFKKLHSKHQFIELAVEKAVCWSNYVITPF